MGCINSKYFRQSSVNVTLAKDVFGNDCFSDQLSISSGTIPLNTSPRHFKFSEDDVIIIVIGLSGVGKSTFIHSVLGPGMSPSERSFRTTSSGIQPVEWPGMKVGRKRRVILVEMPGFGRGCDVAITNQVKSWLGILSTNDLGIFGVVCLHRITDRGFSNHPIYTMRRLCRETMISFPNRVVLVTTMWDRAASISVAENQFQELQTIWDRLLLAGPKAMARIMRFDVESSQSATVAISALFRNSDQYNMLSATHVGNMGSKQSLVRPQGSAQTLWTDHNHASHTTKRDYVDSKELERERKKLERELAELKEKGVTGQAAFKQELKEREERTETMRQMLEMQLEELDRQLSQREDEAAKQRRALAKLFKESEQKELIVSELLKRRSGLEKRLRKAEQRGEADREALVKKLEELEQELKEWQVREGREENAREKFKRQLREREAKESEERETLEKQRRELEEKLKELNMKAVEERENLQQQRLIAETRERELRMKLEEEMRELKDREVTERRERERKTKDAREREAADREELEQELRETREREEKERSGRRELLNQLREYRKRELEEREAKEKLEKEMDGMKNGLLKERNEYERRTMERLEKDLTARFDRALKEREGLELCAREALEQKLRAEFEVVLKEREAREIEAWETLERDVRDAKQREAEERETRKALQHELRVIRAEVGKGGEALRALDADNEALEGYMLKQELEDLRRRESEERREREALELQLEAVRANLGQCQLPD